MSQAMLSAGIDIGTTTTQVIFSRLTFEMTGGFGSIPKMEITGREVLHRSPVIFTPLRTASDGEEIIHAEAVAEAVQKACQDAGIAPELLDTGAVIITGETAARRNAAEVLKAVSSLVGDFTAAVAGPDLESVLAGKGAGACRLSEDVQGIVANVDIGGGTSNICFFRDGCAADTGCLNIGGRLIRISDSQITYVSPRIQPILSSMRLKLIPPCPADPKVLDTVADRMAELLAEALGLKPPTEILGRCYTNHGITCGEIPKYLVFSGGVASCMEHPASRWQFGDIGDQLASAVCRCPWFSGVQIHRAEETVNATVIGAGNHSLAVSGCTVVSCGYELPLKNIPVCRVPLSEPGQMYTLRESLAGCRERNGNTAPFALSFAGLKAPTFSQIQTIARYLTEAFPADFPILIMEANMGKALGQAILRLRGRSMPLICLDGIHCTEGDFLDIGKPLSGSESLPVVVKTLIFQQ